MYILKNKEDPRMDPMVLEDYHRLVVNFLKTKMISSQCFANSLRTCPLNLVVPDKKAFALIFLKFYLSHFVMIFEIL